MDQHRLSLKRWGWRGTLIAAVAAIVVSLAAFLPRAMSSRETGPKLTHFIARGDLEVTVIEEGTLESSENTEIKCRVRGRNTVIWVIESGSYVEPGDDLIRLDTLFIEEQISERSKYAHWSRSAAERSKADVTRSELAVSAYEQGTYVATLAGLEKDLAIAESSLRTSQNMLDHAELMSDSGYVSDLEVEERQFAVTRAELNVDVTKTHIDVLKQFTKAEQLETLKGNLVAAKARHEANVERAFADASRRDRAVEEHKHCLIKAERGGLVIHPSAARWRNAPEVAEGATVYKDQVLLLMPDLSKMQVKLGIHESIVDRIKPGQKAHVALPDRTLEGEVLSVASVTQPAGWWNGNEVRYDTVIQLPSVDGLKPGMSAEVEVVMAEYDDKLLIPVAAIVETDQGHFCWVKTIDEVTRRPLKLGDSNDVFTIVEDGLQEGDEVVLNPLALEVRK